MIRRWLVCLTLGVLLILLAACGEDNPQPDGDPPVLGGFESLPKQLATIALTPTPSPVIAGSKASRWPLRSLPPPPRVPRAPRRP